MKVNQSTLADDIFISVETLLPTCSFPTYHAHNVYEIYILNSGERNIFIGSKLYHTSPGVVAMIRPHIPHRSFGNTPYSGICVEFSKGYLDEQLSSRERTEVLQCFIQPVISLPEMYLKELWCNAEKVILMISMKLHNAPRIQRQTIRLTVMTLRQTLWTKRKP